MPRSEVGRCIVPLTVRESWIVMLIPTALGDESTQKYINIVPQGILRLSAKYAGGSMQGGNRADTISYSGFSKEPCYVVSEIYELYSLNGLEL